MKQKITNLYLFEELTEEQQKKVLDNNRDICLDMLTSEDIIWDFSEVGQMVADAGFLNPEFEYNVEYVQGRGACFDCSAFNFDLLLEDLDIPHKSLLIKIIERYCTYSITRPNSSYAYHYSHENCRSFEMYWNKDGCPRINKALVKIMNHIENKRYDLCIQACNKLTETYEYLQSDSCVKEHLDLNDIYFNPETGKVDTPTELAIHRYEIVLQYDNRIVAIRTCASSPQAAIDMVCRCEGVPTSAVIHCLDMTASEIKEEE